ncbi:MAG: Hsp70 family protein [Alphaproteobacteria bacterium]
MISCGFDFGTSNSAIGVARDGIPTLAPLERGATLMPTALFFDSDNTRHTLFGSDAIDAYIHGDEGRLMRALKSALPSSLIDQTTAFGRRRVTLREVVAIFVREMKRRAEKFAGREIDGVVHGRPVTFADGDVAADVRAQAILEDIARSAGFKEISFAFEPIAAAIHYESTIDREELILVADIGGGTSDFSVVRIGPQRHNRIDRQDDILANAGARIGGTDFDTALSLGVAMPLLGMGSRTLTKGLEMPKAIYHELATWATINFAYTYRNQRDIAELLADAAEPAKVARLLKTLRKRLGHRIAFAVEEAKLGLSADQAAAVDLNFLEAGLATLATRAGFESAISERTERLTRGAAQCIRDAGVASSDIKTIFFTGGSSLVPAVRVAIIKAAPEALPATRSDLLSVALGLTRMAVQHA